MPLKTGIIVGATGAQGSAVVHHLSSLGLYHLKLITRDFRSSRARDLAALPNVSIIQSLPSGYDEDTFSLAAQDADFVFINTDGFSTGEVAETFLGMRYYELSCRANVKHFIYSSLDDIGKLTNRSEEFRLGSYNAKARVVDFLRAQPANSMKWSAVSGGPYMQMLSEWVAPTILSDGTAQFSFPLGEGKIPLMDLQDLARYVANLIANPDTQVLEVATCHATGNEIVEAFTAATGRQARYADAPLQEYLEAQFKHHRRGVDTPIGLQTFSHMGGSSAEQIFLKNTWRQEFSAWWCLWQSEIIKRDYDELDRILLDRIKRVEEWMVKTEYTGESKPVLKSYNDHLAELRAWAARPSHGSSCG